MSTRPPQDYSTDTDGLPKTDFSRMATLGKHIVKEGEETLDLKGKLLILDGAKAGTFLFEEVAALDSVLKSNGYNAFSDHLSVYKTIRRMIAVMTYAYQARLQIRAAVTTPTGRTKISRDQMMQALLVDDDAAFTLVEELARIAKQKDSEYGASWCKRGGVGAWFTTVRKFDRIATQLRQLDLNLWNVESDVNETESLEETLKDGINYLLLIEEKRWAIEEH